MTKKTTHFDKDHQNSGQKRKIQSNASQQYIKTRIANAVYLYIREARGTVVKFMWSTISVPHLK